SDRNDNSAELVLSVADTGIGIPLNQQTKVFERFHQVSEAHKEVGTGIGLSLVKELVSLMNGTLSLKSEPGKGLPGEKTGSKFTICLPVEVIRLLTETTVAVDVKETLVVEEFSSNGNGQASEEGDSRPTVLVVEDNTDLRKFIIDSLGREFHFLEGADGKQGLEKAFEETPDLIISDVMMPEMDGITMTGKLKNDTRTSHIPIILLTAKTSDESKLSGLETGADDYLTKPFNKHELLLKVRNSIALRVKLREKLKLELLKESPNVEVQSADEKFLLKVRDAILSRLSDEQLSVESLADEIGLSRSQLFRKISALTGASVNELIRTFRLQRAAQLIEQNWGPVTQVAYEVGYSNLSYFSKAFKEKYGVLPSEYGTKVQ
ncbi:MAG TPA: response regulator, partial [Chryseolinea sp.]